MTAQNRNDDGIVRGEGAAVTDALRFCHDAMATTFEIYILDPRKEYAAQAAQAAFDELDRLELELSCFVENSDISRINNLKPGQSAVVGLDCFECLIKAKKLYEQTGGSFDITVGRLYECWVGPDKKLLSPSKQEIEYARRLTGMNLLKFDEQWFTVEVAVEGLRVDPGGIGKGFGVDKITALLREWNLKCALVHGGGSTVLAMGKPEGMDGWPVTLSDPKDRTKKIEHLFLDGLAVSGSGLEHGQHIIDPRKGEPVTSTVTAWSVAKDATTADGLSTAFMVMGADEIKRYCDEYRDVSALVVTQQDSDEKTVIRKYGRW